MPEKITAQLGDKQIIIETGKLAKQADGAVTVQLGETIVLVAAVAATKAKEGQDFFPLTVDYREKAAAAGKFPGGYFKREGRPTEKEILTCRLTDRPIRPLFPKGWYNEVQVQTVLLSADGENDSDILSIIGASAALMVSDIPWAGPLGAVRVGRVNGKFVANPTHAEHGRKRSRPRLCRQRKRHRDVRRRGEGNYRGRFQRRVEIRARNAVQPLIAAQKELVAKAGKKKREITLNIVPDEILARSQATRRRPFCAGAPDARQTGARRRLSTPSRTKSAPSSSKNSARKKSRDFVVNDAFYYIQKEAVRSLILNSGKRLDGRTFEQVRPISSEVGILPACARFGDFRPRRNAGGHAGHARHRRRHAGI